MASRTLILELVRGGVAALLITWLAWAIGAHAAPGDAIPRGQLASVPAWTVNTLADTAQQLWWSGCSSNSPPAEVSTFCVPCLKTPLVKQAGGGQFSIVERAPSTAERAACKIAPGYEAMGGILTTHGHHSGQYGLVRLWIKFPKAPGLGVQFWLWPENTKAPLFEIDGMETEQGQAVFATKTGPYVQNYTDMPVATLHMGSYSTPASNPSCGHTLTVADGQAHTYAIFVHPKSIVMYVDDKETCRFAASIAGPWFAIVNTTLWGLKTNYGQTAWAASPAGDTAAASKYPATVWLGGWTYTPETPLAIAGEQAAP